MSRLADIMAKRRQRPEWRTMNRKDLLRAVKSEVSLASHPPSIDWEDNLLRLLRNQDEFLPHMDMSRWPAKDTKRAIARALTENVHVPQNLLAWLGQEVLEPTPMKRGRKAETWGRDHELWRLVRLIHDNTDRPIDDASHHDPETAIGIVADAFGIEQSTAFERYYAYNKQMKTSD